MNATPEVPVIPSEDPVVSGPNRIAAKDLPSRHVGRLVAGLLALLFVGSFEPCPAAAPGQLSFASPEDASRALVAAVRNRDEPAVARILGGASELISSDDEAQDALERERFVQKYQQMHRLTRAPGGVATLYIGAENWPFPIPLVSRNGAWTFDADGGADEIRFRRIGENEVTAIGICHALVTAETVPGSDVEADRLVNAVLPGVRDSREPVPFHGYFFRILANPGGGFGAIAYPAVYRSSGVMTFVIDGSDIVREKDLGPNTAKVAGKITTYRVDSSWASSESAP